jgi:hypothetical protein
MEIERVSGTTHVVALGLLAACTAFGGTALAAGATSDGIQNANRTAAVRTQSSSTGYELNYFHAYKASKTYAISLKNGLHASFDFEHGTATLWDASGNKTTFSLQQVLLQANNGNS